MSKVCPTCKKEIEDNLTVCNLCGCPIPVDNDENASQSNIVQNNILGAQIPTQKQKEKKIDIVSLIINLLGISSGILSIIFGIIMLFTEKGLEEIMNSYGGDAYTGIQNAAAQTANNIIYFNQTFKLFAFFLLLVIGLVLVLVFLNRFINTIKVTKES